MRIWRLSTTIHTDDNYTREEVLHQISRDANRGDGIYINVVEGNKPLLKTIKHIRKVKDK